MRYIVNNISRWFFWYLFQNIFLDLLMHNLVIVFQFPQSDTNFCSSFQLPCCLWFFSTLERYVIFFLKEAVLCSHIYFCVVVVWNLHKKVYFHSNVLQMQYIWNWKRTPRKLQCLLALISQRKSIQVLSSVIFLLSTLFRVGFFIFSLPYGN